MSAPEVVAGAVAIWVVLFAPGVAVGYALGLRGLPAWALGPALTCSLVGLGGAAAAVAGIRWSLVLFVVLAVILVAAAGAVSRLLPQRVTADAAPARSGAVVGVLLGAAFVGVAMLRSMGSLLAVPAQPDATYHLNSIRSILLTHNISSRDGGVFLYDRAHSFYPSTFHGVAATAGLAVHSAQPVAWPTCSRSCPLVATSGRAAACCCAGRPSAATGRAGARRRRVRELRGDAVLDRRLRPAVAAAARDRAAARPARGCLLSVPGLAQRDAIGRPRAPSSWSSRRSPASPSSIRTPWPAWR